MRPYRPPDPTIRETRLASLPRHYESSKAMPARVLSSDPLAARLVGLEMAEDDAQQRRRHALFLAAADEVADDVIGLDRTAALDVAQHRGAQGRALVGQP